MSMNRVQLIGNIGKEPQFDYKKEDTAVLKFSVAVNSKVKDKKTTEWFNVVAFDKLAETLKVYLKAGIQVYVEGALKIKKYENKDKEERLQVYILAHKVDFFGGKEQKTANEESHEEHPDEFSGD